MSEDEKSESANPPQTEPLAPPEHEEEVTRIYQWPTGYVALDERDKLIAALHRDFPNTPEYMDEEYQMGSEDRAIVTSVWILIKRFLHNMNMTSKALGPYHCVLVVGLFQNEEKVCEWAKRYILESKWELGILPFLISPADYYLQKYNRGEPVDDWVFSFPFLKE